MAKKKKRPQDYCKICDRYKANEKFSGKGLPFTLAHRVHVCLLQKNRKLWQLMEATFRYLSEIDKKWL